MTARGIVPAILVVALVSGFVVGLLISVYLPVVQVAPASGALYVGDKVIASVPGVAPGEVAINYHLSDAILSLEERRYAGDVDFDGGERLAEIALGVGVHALQGSDKPYAGHPDLFRRRYGRLLDTALGMGDQVVAVGIPWLNWVPEKLPRGERWNAIMAEEAAARGVCFADVWTPMLDCGMDCISDDGYHPNELGYELIKREVEKCF
ncbi:MAG: SGNH/GDSL hydrolase family protein [Minisyncoccales bacterium]